MHLTSHTSLRWSILILVMYQLITKTNQYKAHPTKLFENIILTNESRYSSLPFWHYPCQDDFDTDNNVVVDYATSFRGLSLQARVTLTPIEKQDSEFWYWYYSSNNKSWMSPEQSAAEWEANADKVLPGMPIHDYNDIPKLIGEQLNISYLHSPSVMDVDFVQLKSYEFLQKVAAGWEYFVWTQYDNNWPFAKIFKYLAFQIRTMLCDLLYAISSRGNQKEIRLLSRDYFVTHPDRDSVTFAKDASLIIYRDIRNVLEYILLVFDFHACMAGPVHVDYYLNGLFMNNDV